MKLSAKEQATVVRLAFDREVAIPQPEQPPGELRYVIFREAPHFVAPGLNVELSSFGTTPRSRPRVPVVPEARKRLAGGGAQRNHRTHRPNPTVRPGGTREP